MERVSDKIHGAGWGWSWRRLEVGVSKLGVQVLVGGSDSGDGMTLGVPGFGQSLTDYALIFFSMAPPTCDLSCLSGCL